MFNLFLGTWFIFYTWCISHIIMEETKLYIILALNRSNAWGKPENTSGSKCHLSTHTWVCSSGLHFRTIITQYLNQATHILISILFNCKDCNFQRNHQYRIQWCLILITAYSSCHLFFSGWWIIDYLICHNNLMNNQWYSINLFSDCTLQFTFK